VDLLHYPLCGVSGRSRLGGLFSSCIYMLAIHGKIDGGATTGATTHYTDTRNLRCILRSIRGAVCNQPFQKDSFVSPEPPVFGSTVVIGFYHEAMVVGFLVNYCKIPISLIVPRRGVERYGLLLSTVWVAGTQARQEGTVISRYQPKIEKTVNHKAIQTL